MRTALPSRNGPPLSPLSPAGRRGRADLMLCSVSVACAKCRCSDSRKVLIQSLCVFVQWLNAQRKRLFFKLLPSRGLKIHR